MSSKSDEIFLPDFCSIRMFFVVFFLAEILAFLLTLATDFSSYGFLSEFGIRSLLALWIALTSAAILCLSKGFLSRFNDLVVGLTAFFIVQLIAVLVSWLVADALPDWGLLLALVSEEGRGPFYFQMLGISSIVSIVFFRYLYVLHHWRKQVEAQAEARLDALQARMRPHFLFNSLNTIASLTRIEPELAEKLVEDLAELIRASMLIDKARMVRLDEEINIAKLYLNIELQRMDNRFSVKWDIDDVPMDALLPPLSLQPVIENAVYHGIELNPEGSEILIKGHSNIGGITLSVLNTLPPAGEKNERKGNQMAMENLKARIQGCYSGDAHVHMNSTDEHYQVTLVFPYWKEQP